MTNTRDDGDAVAFNIDEIMLEAERRHHEWNRPGVTGQTVRPEQAIEYWYALVAHEKAVATRSRQLAEARAEKIALQNALVIIDAIAVRHEKGGLGKAQRVAREALAECGAIPMEIKDEL